MAETPHTPADASSRLDESLVTRLFDEYLRACETAGHVDVDSIVRKAGQDQAELRRRIAVHQSLRRLAKSFGQEEVPTQFDRFLIRSLLGTGGLGRVYRAYDPTLHREIALKVLDTGLDDSRRRAWILNEARALAHLQHDGIVQVHEVGQGERHDYVVMELVEGVSLSEVLKQLRDESTDGTDAHRETVDRMRPLSARIRCLEQVARALAYCHDCGVIHRDVKPANILFDGRYNPVLVDFGLAHCDDVLDEDARTNITQELIGTPAYLAPEQAEQGVTGTDPRSDQFSFGIVAYELLTLRNPFHKETRSRTLDAITLAHPEPPRQVNPALPEDVELVVLHALERDPSERYATMGQLAADLVAVLEHRRVSVSAPSLRRLARLWFRRRRRAVLGIGAALLLAAAALLSVWIVHCLHERAGIVRELAAVRSQIGELASPVEFEEAGLRLAACEASARRFDAHLLRRTLFGDCNTDVHAVLLAWSRRLSEVIRTEERNSGDAFQRIAWQEIVHLEEQLCEESPWNRDFRSRGTVLITGPPAGETRVYRQDVLKAGKVTEGFRAFRVSDFGDRPIPGYYRVIHWDPSGRDALWEQEFVHFSSWDRARHIPVRKRRDDVRSRAVLIDGSKWPVVHPGENQDSQEVLGHVDQPAFAITPLVTWDEFERFREATGTDGGFARPGNDGLAWLPCREASAYASWAGGRLPCALELAAARRAGVPLQASGQRAHAEWVSDLMLDLGPTVACALRYDLLEEQEAGPSAVWIIPTTRDKAMEKPGSQHDGQQARVGTAFRVAFTADTREAMERAAHMVRH